MIEIKIASIKKALRSHEFRNKYPEFKEEINTYIENPDCKCNIPLYNAILSDLNRLKEWFGEDAVIVEPPLPEEPEQVNKWQVVNCHINDLESFMQGLSHGPKQIAIARWEDQVTVIINDPIFN
jgi:hypothetical protein